MYLSIYFYEEPSGLVRDWMWLKKGAEDGSKIWQ
jgi:hypothetical protein